MSQQSTPLSRREIMKTIGVAAGAVALAPSLAGAQAPAGPVAPPTTITTPPRDFGPGGRAHDVLHRPGHPHRGTGVQRPAPAQHADPAPVDRRDVVGGAGVEQPGPLSRVERHPEQPADALAGGRRSGDGLPQPVEQQQRQHVRLPGPPALVRAPHAPCGPLRERRLDHAHRRQVQRQAAELAQRRRAASRRQLLVHRSPVRRPALRGYAGRGGRAEQRPGPDQEPPGSGARDRR